MTMEVIIAVDVGSSSVKCNAYSMRPQEEVDAIASHPEAQPQQHHYQQEQQQQQQVPLTSLAQSAKVLRAVRPGTGKVIAVEQIIAAAEDCISNVLSSLQAAYGSHDFVVIAVGFSSFTMNLIGLDEDGQPIGEDATISYACNTREVVEEVERLKRCVTTGKEKIEERDVGLGTNSFVLEFV